MLTEDRQKALIAGDMLLAVLDHVLDEQMAGRRPNTATVAEHFHLSIEEVEFIHKRLEDAGEFD